MSPLATISAVLLAALGCSEATAPVSRKPCSGPVDVAVSKDTTPVFAWAPACGMSDFWVVTVPSSPAETEEVVWSFSVPEQTPVGPGIRYGIAPDGITYWTHPRALIPGTQYRVRVMQTVGGDVVVAGGEKVFTH